MTDSILKRLEELEKHLSPSPMVVYAITDSGETIETTVRECASRSDLHFDRVKCGGNLQDLDILLAEMRKAADTQVAEKGCA